MGLFIAVLKLSQVLSGRPKYMLDKSFLDMALDFDFDYLFIYLVIDVASLKFIISLKLLKFRLD